MMGRPSAIFTYHSLDDSGSVISTSPAAFARQMESLAESGIAVVPLAEAPHTPGSVALTFDDGFANLMRHAVPLLESYRFPATFFIVSRYCGSVNTWPSQPSGSVPELPLLSWSELGELPPSITLGAHTVTHPDLRLVSPEECEKELTVCQDQIQQRLGKPVRWLAYPYGASSPEVRAIAARHFDLAVGTNLRYASGRSSLLDLPRIDAYYLRGSWSIDRLFTSPVRCYVAFRHWLRVLRHSISE